MSHIYFSLGLLWAVSQGIPAALGTAPRSQPDLAKWPEAFQPPHPETIWPKSVVMWECWGLLLWQVGCMILTQGSRMVSLGHGPSLLPQDSSLSIFFSCNLGKLYAEKVTVLKVNIVSGWSEATSPLGHEIILTWDSFRVWGWDANRVASWTEGLLLPWQKQL